MKIIVKQEAGTTCAWIVGEDGQTYPYSSDAGAEGVEGTVYLKDGQQVELDVEIAAKGTGDGQLDYPKVTIGEVTEIPATGVTASGPVGGVDPEADQKQGQRPGEAHSEDDQAGGANDTSVLR